MRALGGWIALTPELPAKLLFGRHVWDCAQHADAWGRRLPELRAPAQQSEPANDAMVAFMRQLESPEGPSQTLERIAGVYAVLKPHLVTLYARHLASANPVYEPPTRRILARCLEEERRHAAAGAIVLGRLGGDASARDRVNDWRRRLFDALAKAGGVTGDATGSLVDETLLGVAPESVASDLVETPPAFDRAALPDDLAAAVDAAFAALVGRITATHVVGLASIGRQQIVKLRAEGAPVGALVQLRWTPTPSGWRIVAVELVSTEPVSVAR